MIKGNKYNRNSKSRKILYDNILFDSNLEISCYKLLKENNIDFTYNEEKIILFEGFKFNNVIFYQPNKKKEYMVNNRKVLNTTYTPDFRININKEDIIIYIETKGKENDVYPLKRKMFLKYLECLSENNGYICYFFEPHNVTQIKESIDVILRIINEE